ncbi:hypothetical protein QTH90_05435 [Variovorax sp. J2P1-59]|uniref:hypothetical protein n=1 Tax=Variovorax flavidus TaxID=3053501 RepID=UPI0025788D91|nr:hypothetical protein [Variovorax sp. J2P1-59]MDM0073812.1 hypothetical protein [Variovorax sp. J2P1-59]
MPTLPGMTPLSTTHSGNPRSFSRPGVHRPTRGWVELVVLTLSIPAAALRDWRARGTADGADALEELDEVEWQEAAAATAHETPVPQDWLFWSFFMCTAIAALPLIGIRWTTPEVASTACAFEDAILLALPVVIPLPFLFMGCVGVLVFQPASRTPAVFGIFGVAMALALAAAHALLA